MRNMTSSLHVLLLALAVCAGSASAAPWASSVLSGHRGAMVMASAAPRSTPATQGGSGGGGKQPQRGGPVWRRFEPAAAVKAPKVPVRGGGLAGALRSVVEGKPRVFEELFQPGATKVAVINAWSALVAGFAAYTIATPLETVKTGLQTIPGATAASVVRRVGPKGLFYGLGAMWWAGVPYSVIMYSIYSPIKQGVQDALPNAAVLAAMLAATVAESVGCLFFLPGELVSKRMMKDPTLYSSFPSAARTIVGKQGVRGLYRGLQSTLIRDVPFTIIQFIVFEALRKKLADCHQAQADAARGGKKGRGKGEAAPVSFGESVAVGVAAALVATTATLPLDVVKSNIQTVATKQTFASMSSTLVRQGGTKALFRGFGPYAAINAGKWSASMAVYNTVREYHGLSPQGGGH